MKWEWSDNNTLECDSGASLEKWQVKALLNGASEASLRSYVAKEGWSAEEIDAFVQFVYRCGGFEYK